MNDVYVRVLANLPATIRGFVQEDEAGNYTIFINEVLSPEAQAKTLQHELDHIKKNHLQQKHKSVQELEEEV